MSRPPLPVAATWRELVERHAESAAAMLQNLVELTEELRESEGEDLLDMFAGSDAVLARGTIFCGSAAGRELMQRWHPVLPQVAAALTADGLQSDRVAHEILNFALIAECSGTRRPHGFDSKMLPPLLAEREELSDAQLRSIAFTALALRDTATARAFIDADPISYQQPIVRFEFNLFELLRYLADAIDRRRPADWIEPAWLEYLNLFPLHLAADAASWPDLFCFARVLADLRGEKMQAVADDLHARIERLANEAQ